MPPLCASVRVPPYALRVPQVVNVTLNTTSDTALASGTRFYLTVRATNPAGHSTFVVSRGVALDLEPPQILLLRHATGREDLPGGEWQRSGTALTSFIIAEDLVSPTTCYYQIPGVGDAMWLPLDEFSPGRWTFLREGLALAHGATYPYRVQCTDWVGRVAEAESAGVSVDLTPPECTDVLVGTADGAHQAYQASTDAVFVQWACTDPETPVEATTLLVGSSPGSDDLYEGEGAHYVYRSGFLPHGRPFYVTVVACNAVGRCTNVTSGATVVDATPPEIALQVRVAARGGLDWAIGCE